MRVIVSTLSIIVGMGWSIAYFRFDAGGIYHLVLVIAVVALVTQWLPGRKFRNFIWLKKKFKRNGLVEF
jgi:hypothetical protein